MLVLQPRMSRVRLENWVGGTVGVETGVDEDVDVEVIVAVIVVVAVGVDVFMEVSVAVGVTEAVWVNVGETGRITLGVAVGMYGGVGERIAGRGDGQTIGVATASGMYPPLQAASRRINKVARVFLVIPCSNPFDCIGNSI